MSAVREIERTFAVTCDRTDFRLIHYSLQGNHAHLGPVLADRYHVRMLRTPREVRNALAYVLLNARHHAAKAGRKLSRALAIDPASSGRWFDGWSRDALSKHRILADTPGDPAVAPARTWLLSVGWKQHGPIHLGDTPGR